MSHQSDLIGTDIHAYLAQHERKELLRFLTCGNVDDGKSTLIGRLLHDSKMIYEDQLAAIQRDSLKSGTTGAEVDLALLVDGLQAEREQGITIDVAYRYFSTAKRKFIIADTPGHEQYTRNMATGASTCDLAIILIDARYGVQTQTKRHSFIVALLGIKHVVVAINKMDLMGYRQEVFESIRKDYLEFAEKLDLRDMHFIPMSALKGDNVVNPSSEMPWCRELPLLSFLNSVEINRDRNLSNLRFPVQWVNRPNLDFRGFSGTLAAGVIKRGDTVVALPSRATSRVKSIVTYDGELDEAFAPQAVTVTLEDEIDVSRGDMLVHPGDLPHISSRFLANIVWMTTDPLIPGKPYYFKHTTRTLTGAIAQIQYRIDVNTLEEHPSAKLELNEIGLCEIALTSAIAFDGYKACKGAGAFIIIDRLSNVTVGAGMIVGVAGSDTTLSRVTPTERAARLGQKPLAIWLTGETRQEIAYVLERQLFDRGFHCAVLESERLGERMASLTDSLRELGIICLCVPDENATPTGDRDNLVFTADSVDFESLAKTLRLEGPGDYEI